MPTLIALCGHIVIKNARTNANFLPMYFFESKYAKTMVNTLKMTAGSLTTNTESPKSLIRTLAIAE